MAYYITGLDLIHFGGGILMGLGILGILINFNALSWAGIKASLLQNKLWIAVYIIGYILNRII